MICSITVIGLGSFGSTIALELTRLRQEVIGIDMNASRVNDIADHISQAVVADARDERVLRDLGVHESDVVVVAIGEEIEASILATLLVKSMPKPKVWVKALNHNHHQILEKLGADQIIHPEHEMGLRVARALIYPEVIDYISLGNDYFNVEVRASERLVGKTIDALNLDSHNIRCMLIKHQEQIIMPPLDHYKFELGDQMILLGTLSNLRKISKSL
jgi:trk system potassium uptake protein